MPVLLSAVCGCVSDGTKHSKPIEEGSY